MNILGISAYNYDASAALVVDGNVVAAAQEERFGRDRLYAGFPSRAAKFCLDHAGLKSADLQAVVFYDKPRRRFDRLLKTQLAAAPASFVRFVTATPGWMRERYFFRLRLRTQLAALDCGDVPGALPLLFSEHHISHAASVFYPSPFEESAILTMDGAGEWPCISLCKGSGKSLQILQEQHYPHSLGLLYSAFSRFLGFAVNGGEYKLMALSAYGDDASPFYKKYREAIQADMMTIRDDGSFALNLSYFPLRFDTAIFSDARWEREFGMKRRRPDEPLMRRHANLALAVQRVLESVVVRTARHLKRLTGLSNLCFAGGVAMNSMANGRLEREGIFDQIWVPPAPGDAGGAPGAALAAYHLYFGRERLLHEPARAKQDVWLGPSYSDDDVREVLDLHGAVGEFLEQDALVARTAEALDHGEMVGWYQGSMEFGPRALGNRNIFADPRNPALQRKINLQVKFRESFRPLSPIVLEEEAASLFDNGAPSPYMSFSRKLRDRYRKPLPWNYATLTIKEKLHTDRSDFPAITLVDMSARVQTISASCNPLLHQLISAFRARTGCPMLASTSFNIREKPLVNTPEEAYRTFMQSGLDVLVMGSYYFVKSQQPIWDLVPLYNLE